MKILSLDTSTEICSVALTIDNELRERSVSGMRHAESILPTIETLLSEAGIGLCELDLIAFGRGPGSFTSLRIGASVVQGLAFGADLPVVPVSSLAALAQSSAAARVHAALDARMSQVYAAAFVRDGSGLMNAAVAEQVCSPTEVQLPEGTGWIGVGSGWDQYTDSLRARFGQRLKEWQPEQFPRANGVAVIAAARFASGEALAPELALPVYLRDDVARKAGQ